MASSRAPDDHLLPIGLVSGIAAEDGLGRRTRLGLGEVSLSSCFQLCSHEKSTNFNKSATFTRLECTKREILSICERLTRSILVDIAKNGMFKVAWSEENQKKDGP